MSCCVCPFKKQKLVCAFYFKFAKEYIFYIVFGHKKT